MSETVKGVTAILAASVVWGLSPLFYKLLVPIPPIEILAHRTIWSAVLFIIVLLLQGRGDHLTKALRPGRGLVLIAFAAILVSINWLVFIWSIGVGRVTESSLGYFLLPLTSVVFGFLFFGERSDGLQKLAIALATIGVIVLTLGLGVLPWIALVLALTFGYYGVIKKRLTVDPIASVTAEVVVLSPIAAVVLLLAHQDGGGAFGVSLSDSLLLILSGAMTATPLILFSYAAKRVRLTTMGLIQYVNPSLQFICAVVIFGESFGFWHSVSFAFIWSALGFYTLASLRQEKRRSRAASSASTPSTT